jgi:hypothetical protein
VSATLARRIERDEALNVVDLFLRMRAAQRTLQPPEAFD